MWMWMWRWAENEAKETSANRPTYGVKKSPLFPGRAGRCHRHQRRCLALARRGAARAFHLVRKAKNFYSVCRFFGLVFDVFYTPTPAALDSEMTIAD